MQKVIAKHDEPELILMLFDGRHGTHDSDEDEPIIHLNGRGNDASPLMVAAHYNRVETVRLLLKLGADAMNAAYANESAPASLDEEHDLDEAGSFGHLPLMRQMELVHRHGDTAADFAEECGHNKLVAFMEGVALPSFLSPHFNRPGGGCRRAAAVRCRGLSLTG